MKEKKGQLGSLQSVIAVLIIVGILVGAGLMIMQKFNESTQFTSIEENRVDVGAGINSTGYTLLGASELKVNGISVTSIVNASTGTVIAAGNYTVSAAGVIKNNSAWIWNNTNITYTYKHAGASYIGLNNTKNGMLVLPELLPLVILIVLIGIILGVLFNVIPGSRIQGA